MSIAVIVGMLVVTVGSFASESILVGAGKIDEAKYMNMATKAGMGITALTVFGSFVKKLSSLG